MFRRASIWTATLLTATGGAIAVAAPAQAAPIGAAVSSDYNGDGFGDVAVGEPLRTVNGFTSAGAVRIVYGNASGLTTAGSQFFTEDSPGVPGIASSPARFGWAVASGNFDGDNYADLAMAAPAQNFGAGQVIVLYGSASGLHATPAAQMKAELLGPDQFVPVVSPGDSFGSSLATADFNLDGFADIAIGSPSTNGGGGVAIVYGSASGLLPAMTALWINQDTAGVPGVGEAGDGFGEAITTGDFNGDGRADLGVGMPGQFVNGIEGAGAVVALLTDTSGLVSGAGALVFHQDTAGVPDAADMHDHFGWELAAGDITGDGKAELIAAAAQESVVIVLKGSPSGPTATGSQLYAGVPTELYGGSLAVINADGNAYRDLVIGIPHRTVNSLDNAGSIAVFSGTPNGASWIGMLWTQDTSGVVDQVEANDRFGYSLQAIENTTGTTQKLVIGLYGETLAACPSCGAVGLLPGSPTGLTAIGNQLIGALSLAGSGASNSGFGFALG